MELRIVNNDEKYYDYIRELRMHRENISGFLDQTEITSEQQKKYMEKHKDNYFVCLNDNDEPVGWVGVVDDDIRICTDPMYKNLGIGKYMLNELMKLHPGARAKVLLNNESSNNLFIACDFEIYKEDNDFKYYKRKTS
jgi:ribosomal protein S18 acetylase RimI-like enzyme